MVKRASPTDAIALERHIAKTSPDQEAEAMAVAERKLAKQRGQIGKDVLGVSAAFRKPNALRKIGSFVTAGKVVKPFPKMKDALTIVVSTDEHPLPDSRKVSIRKELVLSETDGVTSAAFSATTSETGQVDPETVYGEQVPLVRITVPEELNDTILEIAVPPSDGQSAAAWEVVTDPEAAVWSELHNSLTGLTWAEQHSQVVRHRYTTPSGPGTGGSSGLSPTMIGAITGGAS